MNQILSTSMPMDNERNNKKVKKEKKVRNAAPTNIKGVIKVFSITILMFGFILVGTGSYALYKNQAEIKEQNAEPTISLENKTDRSLLLQVTHNKPISKVEYNWNNGQTKTIEGNSSSFVEQVIDIPSGTNTLYIVVEDIIGKQATYEKQYNLKSDISLEVAENNIKITYTGEKKISYMTYRWDEEEETKIDINDTNIEQEIEAKKGLHTLTVSVVDENNITTDIKTQKINGVSKPKLEITTDDANEHFIIKASDDEKITKFEIIVNQDENQQYELDVSEKNLKEIEYIFPTELKTGDNVLEVTVYNASGLSKYAGVRFIK